MAYLDTTSTGGGIPANSAPRKPRILLAASGSVAAIKFANLCHCFSEWAEVRAVATKASLHFIDRTSLPKDTIFYTDEDEWSSWKKIGDTVLHIDLRRWADIMVIAPLSANTLGKLAGGLCDNLLTCIVRAWDYSKPLFIAPAMNTFMWKNPFTERHLMTIDELGVTLIPPVSKRLACGDYGNGAMAEPSLIYSTDGSQMLFTSLNQITKEIEIRVARAIVSRADIDMDEIQKIFLKKYGIEIDEAIRGRIVSGV